MGLIGDVCKAVESDYFTQLIHYKRFHYMLGKYLPGDITCYERFKLIIPNTYFTSERKLDKTQILRLASCSYIQQAQNVIILGATGTDKTYLACALGMAANRNFYEVNYMRLPDLLVEIAIVRGSSTYR